MKFSLFLAKAALIIDDCSDPRWRWFKGCLGALDGTFIGVRVPEHEKGQYRTRKRQVAVNVLGVYNPNMQFVYVLSGWEGSAVDRPVLCDAIHRPHGLRVLSDKIILVCCLLHNFLRNEMPDDPLELEIPNQAESCPDGNVECIDTTTTWTNWRDQLASSMYNE
ncbi:UNVERIFIED_CONTAM: hypothetical protein Slati_2743700 [Sesamum latifolium]|uniref:DDE Tnp4 domain-containing protein n=1 Tax=Sesamum latifolium TaxID=2727402 RepID=A0AAW2VWJ4_9LAMI